MRGHFAPPVFEMREMRARIGNQMIGWIMKKTQGRCPVKTRELERGENHQKADVLISFFFSPFHLTDILSSVSLMVPDHLTTVSPVTHNEYKQKPIGVGLYSVMVRQWQVTFTSVSGHLQGAAVCWCVSPSWTCMIWLQARSHLPALIGFSTCTLARGLSLMGSLPSSVNGRLP